MIRSMTGHGAASCEHEGMHIAVELRSVNNRSFKAMLRLPDALGSLEGELEAWLARRVARGSVSLTVRLGDGTARSAGRINTEALRGYLQQLQAVDAAARLTGRQAEDDAVARRQRVERAAGAREQRLVVIGARAQRREGRLVVLSDRFQPLRVGFRQQRADGDR